MFLARPCAVPALKSAEKKRGIWVENNKNNMAEKIVHSTKFGDNIHFPP